MYIFEYSGLHYQMNLLESLLCGPVLFPAYPPFPQHVTILSTSSGSMACITHHRRRPGAPQKEAGAHTKTFAFLHLIRVVIARQHKPPAPRYLASFYRWRLKRASKCQLLTAEKRVDLPGATSLFRPRPTSSSFFHPFILSCVRVSLEPSHCWPAQGFTSPDNCQLTCMPLISLIHFLSPAFLYISLNQQLFWKGGGGNVLNLTQNSTITIVFAQ